MQIAFTSDGIYICYCEHIFYYASNLHPDAYNEEFAIYQGVNWALSLGRWAIRFINLSMNNIVFPIFNLLLSYVCIFFSAIVIIDIFRIKRKIYKFFTIVILLIVVDYLK